MSARYPFTPPEYATKGERLAQAIEEWGGGPAVMVGDRRSDGEAAQYAGAEFIGAAYGYGAPDELAAAAHVIHHMAQLYNLLLTPEEQRQCGII